MVVEIKIVAFIALLLCPCSCAKQLTGLVPSPPAHNPVQDCCYYIHFTDGKTEAFKD